MSSYQRKRDTLAIRVKVISTKSTLHHVFLFCEYFLRAIAKECLKVLVIHVLFVFLFLLFSFEGRALHMVLLCRAITLKGTSKADFKDLVVLVAIQGTKGTKSSLNVTGQTPIDLLSYCTFFVATSLFANCLNLNY